VKVIVQDARDGVRLNGMKRRHFIGSTAAVAAAGTLGIRGMQAQQAALRINGARINQHLKALSEFGKNPQGGVSRVAYSEADKQGRAYVMGLMKAASLDVSIDTAGNIWGRRKGTGAGLKPIVFGSHIDSVPEGGNYDGDVGSLGAIEVAQTFTEKGVTTRHPLEVVVWQNEEGGLYGSHAATSAVTAQELAAVAVSGKTIRDGITFIGGDPSKLESSRKAAGSVRGYFELHIEQGGTLEIDKLDIGIVEGIVAINRWDVTIEGFANHAGTTAMSNRKDAMLSAARFIDMANRVVTSEPGRQVGTVGRIQAFPGAVNVIPGRVECSLEIRDLDEAKIARLGAAIQAEARKLGAMNGTTFTFKPSSTDHKAALSDPVWRGYISSASKVMGLTTKVMPSGAGHDAQNMARIGPMAMIFIPSIGGISHSPKEYSTPKDIENGVNVLMHAVLAADAAG
jgi:N-carbamoyl-L-amino-acid hydrolase